MINQQINLITQEGKERLRLLKIRQKIKNISIIVVAGFVVVSLFVLTASILTTSQKNRNAKTYSLLSAQITGQEKIESYALITANRIKIINDLFKDRKSYHQTLAVVEELLVPGFYLQDVDLTSQGLIKITGGCLDVQSLTNFNQKIEEIKARKEFAEVIIPSIGRGSNGQYTVALELKK